jgi:lipopolysaccharide biosynthesis glycosyltransferase
MVDIGTRITIVYACDNNFVSLLGASIKSLEVNSPENDLDIYVINDGISKLNILKLQESITSSRIDLKIINIEDVKGAKENVPRLFGQVLPITTFFRLFIHTFLPPETERVLYLDCDMIVLSDVSELWKIDLDGKILAAVQDPGIKTLGCSWGGGVKNYEELGFKSDDKYLNAGLLLINLKEWVSNEIPKKALEAAVIHRKHIVYSDQYCLNAVLATRWLELDPGWNHLVSDDAEGAKLLHYIGNKPTYTNYPYSKKYQDIFFEYLNQTPWNTSRQIGPVGRRIRLLKQFVKKLTS